MIIIIIFAITKLDSQTAKFAFDLIQKTYQSLHSANKKETSSRERQRVMEQHLFCPGAFIHSFILATSCPVPETHQLFNVFLSFTPSFWFSNHDIKNEY